MHTTSLCTHNSCTQNLAAVWVAFWPLHQAVAALFRHVATLVCVCFSCSADRVARTRRKCMRCSLICLAPYQHQQLRGTDYFLAAAMLQTAYWPPQYGIPCVLHCTLKCIWCATCSHAIEANHMIVFHTHVILYSFTCPRRRFVVHAVSCAQLDGSLAKGRWAVHFRCYHGHH